MLHYNPRNQHYPGDDAMRKVTSLSKRERSKKSGSSSVFTGQQSAKSIGLGGKYAVKSDELKAAIASNRICGGSFGNLSQHLLSFNWPGARLHDTVKCFYCGKPTYTKCMLVCKAPLCTKIRGKDETRSCSIHWHDRDLFGMAWKDSKKLASKHGMKHQMQQNGQTKSSWII